MTVLDAGPEGRGVLGVLTDSLRDADRLRDLGADPDRRVQGGGLVLR